MIHMNDTTALLKRIVALQSGQSCETTRIVKDSKELIQKLYDENQRLVEQMQNVQYALKNSISWHDDSGRYIPAFDTLKEASLMYEFDILIEQDEQ